MVIVSEGELAYLEGRIISISGNKITMMPKHEDLKEALEFAANELRKLFKVGDHVKVITGRYEDETGLVVRVEENVVVVFRFVFCIQRVDNFPKVTQPCMN